MATSSLPFLDHGDPRLKLKVENRIRNVFVTQSADLRPGQEKDVVQIPVVTDAPGRVLEAGVNTLQKTLVLKKQAELDEVDQRLAVRRQEFKNSVVDLSQRKSDLEMKYQLTKERAIKFEKFVTENEMKRQRAMKKYGEAREQNVMRQREIEELTEQLKKLRARHEVLKERMTKYQIYEDYLMKTLNYFPRNHFDNGSDSLVMPIIQRHETLSVTNQELLQRLGRLEEVVEEGQQKLHSMKQEHGTRKLKVNKEITELQAELDMLKEKNKQAEVNLLMMHSLSREKVEEVGSLLMAINNLAEQCYLPDYGALEDMSVLTMLDMVKEYILDKADTERRARRLMESGSAMTSRTAFTDKRGRASTKSSGSKTQMNSSSRVSKKSETMA
ncbi:uncharacterized protein CCDC197 [Cynoglossus semilaevis]|uniref:uncharacterized protein CCDC197 n=1 Tax=Cynoglossus semilaevis TaxID=244447 RepID=UPI000495A1C2|nr:uncharacterized protein CCDC197 [Cynoglossus semilaevis]